MKQSRHFPPGIEVPLRVGSTGAAGSSTGFRDGHLCAAQSYMAQICTCLQLELKMAPQQLEAQISLLKKVKCF
jgi:hypothetical protein